ncbi:hypothetical protein T05_2011 [Trichinella murrelli]|uniref:Uncharacterized protein n=1 Tax=Trichinella murrelli TaxID=144512 RepID=A0A0V0U1L3_9BILA|nr:hypothetical protein T05_2011 [Trichinella murrelli]
MEKSVNDISNQLMRRSENEKLISAMKNIDFYNCCQPLNLTKIPDKRFWYLSRHQTNACCLRKEKAEAAFIKIKVSDLSFIEQNYGEVMNMNMYIFNVIKCRIKLVILPEIFPCQQV